MKTLFKIIAVLFLIALIAASVELLLFANDESFWNSIPETEEADYFEHYERL